MSGCCEGSLAVNYGIRYGRLSPGSSPTKGTPKGRGGRREPIIRMSMIGLEYWCSTGNALLDHQCQLDDARPGNIERKVVPNAL